MKLPIHEIIVSTDYSSNRVVIETYLMAPGSTMTSATEMAVDTGNLDVSAILILPPDRGIGGC